jgi:hypothetical protein
MTFIVTLKNGKRIQYNNKYDESDDNQRDLAWEDVNNQYPDASYIEAF